MQISLKLIFAAAMGTIVEYYDYALFTIFLPVFSPLFFPADSIYHSIVRGYFVLWIAMFARPMGGLFFGYFGDRYGRRHALLFSIWGIVLATIVIGLTPSYAVIGMAATILITLCKGVQVFCFGGEYNGAGIFIVEHAQNKNEALAGSIFTAIAFIGGFLACLIGMLLTNPALPKESWRLAFIVGGLIGVVGIFTRRNLRESPEFERGGFRQETMLNLLKRYPLELLTGFFIGGYASIPLITILTFINPVLMAKGYITAHQMMEMQVLILFVAILTFIPAGIFADKISPATLMKASCWAMILFSYPLLTVVDKGEMFPVALILSLMAVITECFHGPSHAYSKNLFKVQYRYRASSIGFGTGVSLLGSVTPIVENYLYELTGQFSSSCLWLMFISAATLMGMHMTDRKLKIAEYTLMTG